MCQICNILLCSQVNKQRARNIVMLLWSCLHARIIHKLHKLATSATIINYCQVSSATVQFHQLQYSMSLISKRTHHGYSRNSMDSFVFLTKFIQIQFLKASGILHGDVLFRPLKVVSKRAGCLHTARRDQIMVKGC